MTADAFEILGAPDFVEPFEAWRVWRVIVDRDGCTLGSVIKSTRWPCGDAFVADCLRTGQFSRWLERRRGRPHVAPETSCECGIYAATLRECGQYLADSPLEPASARVVGLVSLWGTVVECERGFRASHAYPLRIYVPADPSPANPSWEQLVTGLEVYGVPVEVLPTRRAEAIGLLERRQLAAQHHAEG